MVKQSTIIRGKAPLRVSFAGGGTDVSPYLEEFGGCVLSCTIAKHVYASVEINNNSSIIVQSLDYGETFQAKNGDKLEYDGKLDLAKATLKNIGINEGCKITIRSDAPPGSGLGASASMATVMIGVLLEWKDHKITRYELAELAYKLEREELKIKGGKQDQYAAAFGGFNFIQFYRDYTIVNPLRISPEIINELTYRGVLCYTKRSIEGSDIIDDQINSCLTGKSDVIESLHKAKVHAMEMKDALLLGRIDKFGEILHESWENKKHFSSMITNPLIDEIYETARKNGALGGKLLGAGGGGYLFFISEPDKRNQLVEAMRNMGVQTESLLIEKEGLQTWRV